LIGAARGRATVTWRPAAPSVDRVTEGLVLLLVLGLVASITVAQGSLLLLGAWLIVRRRHARPMRWPLLGVLLAFAAWTVLSALASDDPARSLRSLRGLVWLATPYVLLAALPDTASARRFLTALLVGLTGVAALAVVQVLACSAVEPQALAGPIAELFRKCERARGFFSIYMTLGGVLMLVLVAALPGVPREPRRRVSFLLAWGLGAAALALTFVRGAWLGFGLGVVVGALGGRRRAVTLTVLGVGAGLLLLLPGVLDRARTIGDVRDPTTRERLAMLEAGLSMLEERPIFGAGPGQVRGLYPLHAPDYAVRRSTSHLHNSPLQIAVERGLPGLALWLAIFGGFFVRALRILAAVPADRRGARALVLGSLSAMAAFLVAGLFEYNFGDSEVWLVAGSLMALPFVVERDLEAAA